MITVILDLEATCWETGTTPGRQEVIEIGAVKLNNDLEVFAEFDALVRPRENPLLSEFCRELTTIQQDMVDSADLFPAVFERFVAWIGDAPYRVASWGDYDIKQLKIECKRHGVRFPKRFEKRHVNVKKLFADRKRIRPCGMKAALELMHMPLEGRHHRAIDDVRNIAKIARKLL